MPQFVYERSDGTADFYDGDSLEQVQLRVGWRDENDGIVSEATDEKVAAITKAANDAGPQPEPLTKFKIVDGEGNETIIEGLSVADVVNTYGMPADGRIEAVE